MRNEEKGGKKKKEQRKIDTQPTELLVPFHHTTTPLLIQNTPGVEMTRSFKQGTLGEKVRLGRKPTGPRGGR